MTNKISQYLQESQAELRKVAWPNKKTLVRLTVTVIVVTLAVGVYLGALDYLFNKALGLIIK